MRQSSPVGRELWRTICLVPGHSSIYPHSVLPNFEVKITPQKPYILSVPGYMDEIQLDIQAR